MKLLGAAETPDRTTGELPRVGFLSLLACKARGEKLPDATANVQQRTNRECREGRPGPEKIAFLRILCGKIEGKINAAERLQGRLDATGVGAGLTDLLRSALGERVMPVVFTGARKSDIGWRFIAACDAGRFRDHAQTETLEVSETSRVWALQREFWSQAEAAEVEYLPGPGQRIRWGVPEAAGHDDLLVSAALCVILDEGGWGTGGSVVVRASR